MATLGKIEDTSVDKRGGNGGPPLRTDVKIDCFDIFEPFRITRLIPELAGRFGDSHESAIASGVINGVV